MESPYNAPGSSLDVPGEEAYQPKFLAASGRIGRLRYLAYTFGASMLMYLAAIPLIFIAGMMGGVTEPGQAGTGMGAAMLLIVGLIYVAAFAIMFIYAKRRLNDLGQTGWLGLLYIIPLVNLFFWIYLQFFPGNKGANAYGPAPVANSGGVVAAAVVLFVVVFLGGVLAAVAIPAYQDYVKRAESAQMQ